MRKPTRMAHAVLLASGAVFTSATMLMTVLPTSKAVAGIAETKHNLGALVTSQTNNNYFSDGTGAGNQANNEICVFCHTPHGADTTAAVPLWNKSLAIPEANTYSMYSDLQTATFDADEAEIGSVSLACLSCHDGTQAMDNIVNAPLSGGYSSAGGGANGRTFAQGSGTSRGTMDSNGFMKNSEAAGYIPMLGTDLTNDHPISMSYCGGDPNLAGAGTADIVPSSDCKDEDFATATYVSINTKDYWFVEASNDSTPTRDKNDMILYTRTVGSSTTYTWPTVECGSCHDPHTTTATFLRVADVEDAAVSSGRLASGATGAGNAYSAVCLACHVK